MELQSQGEAEHCILLLHPSHNQELSATSPHTLSTRWCEPGLCPGLHPSPRLPAWELPLPAAEEGWSRYLLLWLLQCVTVAWLSGRERRTAPSAPMPLGHYSQASTWHWHPSLGHICTPLPVHPQPECPCACWGTPASHILLSRVTGKLAHSVCCCWLYLLPVLSELVLSQLSL